LKQADFDAWALFRAKEKLSVDNKKDVFDVAKKGMDDAWIAVEG